jgi:transcriptional regulator with XRE-family HTH domain
MPFADRLKELRQASGLTQQELADRAGLHKMGLVKLELSSRQPTWDTVQALAKALGVDCTAFTDRGEGGGPSRRLPKAKPAEPPQAAEKKPARRAKKK